MIVTLAFFSFFVLNACGSDEIPEDATVAVCPQGDTFKYVFKDDIVYEFYSNDVLQSEDMLNIVKDSASAYEDFQAYLDATFQEGVCTLSSFSNTKG